MVRLGDLLGSAVALATTGVLRFPGHGRIPTLEVLYTSSQNEARAFLSEKLDSDVLGMDLTWGFQTREQPFASSSLLQIAAGRSVLILDLSPTPEAGKPATPLTRSMCGFLRQPNRTFYDHGMPLDAARLAFELDCVFPNGVDLSYVAGAWPEALPKAESIITLANRVLRSGARLMSPIEKTLFGERPLSREHLQYAAERAYLSWAIADHFLSKEGPARKNATVTQEKVYEVGQKLFARGMPGRQTRHDWTKLETQLMQEAAAEKKMEQNKKKRTAKKVKTAEAVAIAAEGDSATEKKREQNKKKGTAKSAKRAEDVAAAAEEAATEKKREQNKKKRTPKAAKKAEAADAAAEGAAAEKKREQNKKKRAAQAAKKSDAAAEQAAAEKKREQNKKKRAAQAAKKAQAAAAAAEEEAAAEKKREQNKRRRAARAAKKAEAAATSAEEEAAAEKREQSKKKRVAKTAKKASAFAEEAAAEKKREQSKKKRTAKTAKKPEAAAAAAKEAAPAKKQEKRRKTRAAKAAK